MIVRPCIIPEEHEKIPIGSSAVKLFKVAANLKPRKNLSLKPLANAESCKHTKEMQGQDFL